MGVLIPQRLQLNEHTQHLSPNGDKEMLYGHYAPTSFAMQGALAKNAVMLFDELTTCAPSVQAAMLRVVLEGCVGELELPSGIRMLLAMNAVQDSAGGYEIAPPLANRLGWIEWESPSVGEFTKHLVTNGDQDAPITSFAAEEATVDALWGAAWARAMGEVTGFLARRSELLLIYPHGKDRSRAWPSPRTWELAARALAGSYIYALTAQERELAVSAYVGSAAYSELFVWTRDADLPLPQDLLDGKVSFIHSPARYDRTAAVLTACAGLVTPPKAPMRQERSLKFWQLMLPLTADAVDVLLPAVTALVQARLNIGMPAAYQVLAKMEPVMSAADLRRGA
jgi:hypothetical protein